MAIFEHEYMVNMEKIGSKSNLITNKGLLNIFQDIGCLHSDVAGLGINDIPNTHLSWVVLHWKVKVLKRAKYGEILKVKTWSRSATKVHCYRDFAVYNKNDELVCMATSKWTLTNIEKKSLEKITDDIVARYTPEEKYIFNTPEIEKLKEPTNNQILTYTFKVPRRDIDVNNHVHNLYYLDYAYEALPEEIYNQPEFNNLEIMYKTGAKLGNIVNCYYSNYDNSHCITLKSEDNSHLHAIIKLS